jgi:Ca-activated chloride channel family protein
MSREHRAIFEVRGLPAGAAARLARHVGAVALGVAAVILASCAQAPAKRGQGAAGGGLEEIVVTGARASRPQTELERNQAARQAAREAARQRSYPPSAPTPAPPAQSSQLPSITSAGVTPLFGAVQPDGREAAGSRPEGGGPPLARAEPGEELWIIETARTAAEPQTDDSSPGSGTLLAVVTPDAQRESQEIPLPLQHTDVHAVVTGYIGTVDVTQQFTNPYDEKIEAVYLFPLPEKAAVSEFVMTIGERKIRGILREKEEAERIYVDARAQGYQASLLVQRRPNVFEQKVANIEPGKEIDVSIRYFHTLAYEDGSYSFVFPTVVGPRYNPIGTPDPIEALPRDNFATPASGTAVRYLRPSERSAHDISIAVDVDAGVAIESLDASMPIKSERGGASQAHVELAAGATIPNRDFVLTFRVAGDSVKSNLMTYVDPKTQEGYFTLMLYPPAELARLERRPIEMVFVLDTSGSMAGRPLEQAVAAVEQALDHLAPTDTFQILNFFDRVSGLGPQPVRATPANIDRGRRYLHSLAGAGGTEMINGIRAALGFARDPERPRYVTFLTDGYIGNEAEILGEVHRSIGAARIFSFGVGNAVNRYLLDGLATEGRGAAAYLALEDSAAEVMQFFFDRISHPALTDVAIDWQGLRVHDVFPARLPDLFVGRPVVVTGRYSGAADGIVVRGKAATSNVQYRLAANAAGEGAAIRNLWARLKIEDLSRGGTWTAAPSLEVAGAIRRTALEYGLMSAYTSFEAVDASERTSGARGTTVNQAVPVPSGVRYDTAVSER